MKTKNLGKVFEKISYKNRKPCFIFDENQMYSFEEVNIISNKILNFFHRKGIKQGDILALESSKNIFSLCSIIACLKGGVTYSFIELFSAKKRVQESLDQLKPKKILSFTKKYYSKKNLFFSKKILKDIDKMSKNCKFKNKSYLAYIMFTSGSTGRPKGVKISHLNLFYLIKWAKKYFDFKKEIFSNINPLHFDNSVFDIYASIFNGYPMIPVNKHELFDGKNLLKKLNKLNCTNWFSVPSLLDLIIKTSSKNIFKKNNFKRLIFGGERFPIKSIKQIYKFINRKKIFNVSGPTECTCICSAHQVKKEDLKDKNENIFVGQINNYFNYRINYLNNETKKGELYLEGPSISEGYINNSVETKKNFYKTKKNRGYKTGDLVSIDKKKNIKIHGRVDNQIKFLGHRIELEEIENKIIKKFKVNNCLVVIKKMNHYPHKKLVLITDNKKVTKMNIFFNLKNLLPNYMIPTEINLINKFQYNKNFKIDRSYYKNDLL